MSSDAVHSLEAQEPQSAWAAVHRDLSESLDSDVVSVKSPSSSEEQPPTPEFLMSTWIPTSNNVLRVDDKRVFCQIAKGERACFVGMYKLRVLGGTIDICGATLRTVANPENIGEPGPAYRVYAPATHALAVIEGKAELSTFEICSIANSLEYMGRVLPSFDNVWASDGDFGSNLERGTMKCASFEYIHKLKDDPKKRIMQPMFYDYDQLFQQVKGHATKIKDVPKVLVCGPVRSGKSTFARSLTNCFNTAGTDSITGNIAKPIHNPVYFLDLDPAGQEFGPQAYLSLVLVKEPLLGPAMTHPCNGLAAGEATFLAAYPFHHQKFSDDMISFLNCTKHLLMKYKELTANNPTPLVINTPGWKKDDTFNIIRTLVGICGQNVVIGMKFDAGIGDGGFNKQAMGKLQTTATDYKSFYNISLAPYRPTLSTRSAKDLAYMKESSFFHRSDLNTWTTYPIYDYDFISMRYEGPDKTLIGVGIQYRLAAKDFQRWEILAWSTVALIQITDPEYAGHVRATAAPGNPEPSVLFPTTRPPSRIPWLGAAGLAKPLNPAKYKCLGIVWVFNYDEKNAELLLVAPPPLHQTIQEALVMPPPAGVGNPSFVLVMDDYKEPEWVVNEEENYKRHEERERVASRGGNPTFSREPTTEEDDGLIAEILKDNPKFFEDQAVGHVPEEVQLEDEPEEDEGDVVVPCPNFL